MTSPTSPAVPRIFVSHSHEDDDYCHDLVAELRTILGSADAVWYDEHNLSSGELLTEIQRQLHARPIFIVVLSKAALHRSTWVADECRWAFQLRQREPSRVILPVTGAPIETADFYPDWMYLEGFKRIEAPGLQPFPAKEAARRSYNAITPSLASVRLAHSQQPASSPPPPAPPIAPEHFPERLAALGFVPRKGTDTQTGKETAYILPPTVPVPAGSFQMGTKPGSDPDAEFDGPAHTASTSVCAMARYPVTVAEYACFVRAGHTEPRQGDRGVDWRIQLTRLDHPVTCVSWHYAVAYAEWLARLSGQPWRLPSEEDWEGASRLDPRTGRSFVYPWGDTFDAARRNTSESDIHTTTPVGTYGASGASPVGAEDMVGNVWEWTNSTGGSSTYTRELLSGLWVAVGGSVHALYRQQDGPDDVSGDLGFRLVVAPVRTDS